MLSVSSSVSCHGFEPRLGDRSHDILDEIWIVQLASRQVDADGARRGLGQLALPPAELLTCLAKHPAADGNDQAGLLGQ